jgi:uncharacterized protein YbbK (DUF523 family)
MIKILISACLMGEQVKYDGNDNWISSPLMEQWKEDGRLVSYCPEVAGGLPTPRPPVEIQNGEGREVINGSSRAINRNGDDVTRAFLDGAKSALEEARKYNITIAVLKERSPSCGVNTVYNGRFDGTLVPGKGVTARLLEQNGIRTFSENQLDEVTRILDED